MKFIFGFFGISVFIMWTIIFYVAFLLDEKGYKTSLFFPGVLHSGMRRLSKEEKKFLPLYYAMIVTTILPIAIFFALLIYGISGLYK
ncbi:MAG: hypothetical protein CVT94_03645 [Bacteroidetes bacterium HGW-Bacteroidetes-11]|jgi:glucose-6-phosphate-specific signal transduction histidine kinase|nr:MAG: hypothetical protein CVT94_03645 [Bacteroidetes bacterium HGW-Bacteroidetes-11]